MVKRTVFALLVVVVLLGIFFVLQGLGEETQEPTKKVMDKPKKEEVWDGRSEHIYNMEIPDGEGGVLVLDRVSFVDLRAARTTAIVHFVYQGNTLPSWLRPKNAEKTFSAAYQASDDNIATRSAVGPLEDGKALVDYTLRNVPSVRFDRRVPRGVFVSVQGPLPRQKTLQVRITGTPKSGYRLGSR